MNINTLKNTDCYKIFLDVVEICSDIHFLFFKTYEKYLSFYIYKLIMRKSKKFTIEKWYFWILDEFHSQLYRGAKEFPYLGHFFYNLYRLNFYLVYLIKIYIL